MGRRLTGCLSLWGYFINACCPSQSAPMFFEDYTRRVADRSDLSLLAGSELRTALCALVMLACPVVDPLDQTKSRGG